MPSNVAAISRAPLSARGAVGSQAQAACGTQAVQEAARDAAGTAAARARQQQAIALDVPYWHAARAGGGAADPDGAALEPPRPADYLTPYLPPVARAGAGALAPADAADARDRCLHALKQRLVERANIIQTRRNEAAAALARREARARSRASDPGHGRAHAGGHAVSLTRLLMSGRARARGMQKGERAARRRRPWCGMRRAPTARAPGMAGPEGVITAGMCWSARGPRHGAAVEPAAALPGQARRRRPRTDRAGHDAESPAATATFGAHWLARLGAQAALARDREAAGGEAAGAERGVADARFRLRILDRRLRANEEHAVGRFQALVARLAADARLASLREPG